MGAATSKRRGGSAAAVLDFAVAAIVATQIRHANTVATLERSHLELADQTERLNCLIASAIPGAHVPDGVPAGRLGHADHYLEKPLRVDQLIETATALIGRGRPLSDDLRRGNLRAWL